MTMLAETNREKGLTLADYEARIYLYKEQIGTGYIGMGRTLLEAKEAKVVPHGAWESWVTRTTGLTVRQAQRLMQAATEIKDGSAMARLEMSKALLLLGSGLDEDAREEIAEKAADEGATVRELREALKQEKLKRVQETGAAAEIRQELERVKRERESLEQQIKATIEGYQKRMDQAEEDAYRRGMKDSQEDMRAEIRREYEGKISFINGEKQKLEAAQSDLLARLEEERNRNGSQWDEGYKAGSRNAGACEDQIQQLKANQQELLEAVEEAEKRAAEAEAARDAAQDGSSQEPAAHMLNRCINAFFSECELMPFYPEEMRRDESAIRSSVAELADWCRRMDEALDRMALDAEAKIV